MCEYVKVTESGDRFPGYPRHPGNRLVRPMKFGFSETKFKFVR